MSSAAFVPVPAVISDREPVVAQAGGVRLVLHARKLRGTRTLVQAAQLCGLNRDELSKIERGETKQIRFDTLAKLLAGYQCQLTDLVEVKAEPFPQQVPLYTAALAALGSGLLAPVPPQRRTVRRDASADVVHEHDESAFAATADAAPDPEPRRRRRPTGTLVR